MDSKTRAGRRSAFSYPKSQYLASATYKGKPYVQKHDGTWWHLDPDTKVLTGVKSNKPVKAKKR